MPLIESDRPSGCRPRADENLSICPCTKMGDQRAADPVPLTRGKHIRVANEIDVAYPLNTHHSCKLQSFSVFATYEIDLRRNLRAKLGSRHVRLVPAICRNHAAIFLGRRIDDREHPFKVAFSTRSHDL